VPADCLPVVGDDRDLHVSILLSAVCREAVLHGACPGGPSPGGAIWLLDTCMGHIDVSGGLLPLAAFDVGVAVNL
jgi:hypothetical protein